jgi:RNA polymerase sigma-70 factor (ECF subfamily)
MRIEEARDAELARRCRAGDPAAWRELVRRHGGRVHRLAVRMLGDGADADDAFQETFLRVRRSFDSNDPTRPLRPWVSRTAYNVCTRKLGERTRGRARVAEVDEVAVFEDVDEPGPEARVAGEQSSRALLGALESLSAEDRGIVLMRYREGLSVAEVAEATGMPANTVKTRLHRARAGLRALLAPLLGRDAT